MGDLSSISGLVRSPGEGNCLRWDSLDKTLRENEDQVWAVITRWLHVELKFQRKKRDCDAGPWSSGYTSSKDVESLQLKYNPQLRLRKRTTKGRYTYSLFVICCCSEGDGTPLQYSCLENPMDGGACWAAVHGSRRVGHDWVTSLSLFTFMHWRRKWQPTPVFLPGEFHGQRSLDSYSLLGCKEVSRLTD